MSPITGVASGRLDRQIVIETAQVSTDPTTGQDVADWDAVAGRSVAAEWLPESATEVWKARQIDATVEGVYMTHDLSPRPTPESARIVGHDQRVYDIKGVTEIGRNRGLLISVATRAEAV